MRETIWTVQYLRAIAAIGVVAFHVLLKQDIHLDFLASGVDLFFVISGFIMAQTPAEVGPWQFLWRRLVRIVPLYWLATAIKAAVSHPSAQDLLLSLFFIPHVNAAGQLYPVLTPGWTLNFEMWFYICFAALVCSTRLLAPLIGAFSAMVVLGFALHQMPPMVRLITSPLLLEFLAGAWLGWCFDFTKWDRLMPRVRIGKLFGDASYAIYLFQGAFITVAWPLASKMPAIAAPLTIGACVAGGCLVHLMVEKPLLKVLRGLRLRLFERGVWTKRPASP